MEQNTVSFIAYHRPSNKYSLNVIVGALETVLQPQDGEIIFVSKEEALVSAVRDAQNRRHKVVVGWSVHSPQFVETVAQLSALRLVLTNDQVIHLAGGTHPTAEPEQTLRAGFDAVAIGEGEKMIVEFVTRLLRGEDLFQTKGIAYLSNGKYISNGFGDRVDLNDYPPFAPRHGRFNPIEITRGCVYACGFCQTPFMFKARFRHRTVENVTHWVKLMKSRGLMDIRFISPTAFSYGSSDTSANLDKVEGLLDSVRTVLGTKGRIFLGTFPSEVRPEHISSRALFMLKKYVNNDNLVIGGQSGSQRVLNLCHRGHTVNDIISAVKISLEVGFIPNVDFIFGLPGEDQKDLQATLKLMEVLIDMGARIHGHTFMPLPGTPFKNAQLGVIPRDTLKKLTRLASQGKLYGDWKKQVSIAKTLTNLRKPKRP
jgi:B12-binding domain/radical SAM domain protein